MGQNEMWRHRIMIPGGSDFERDGFVIQIHWIVYGIQESSRKLSNALEIPQCFCCHWLIVCIQSWQTEEEYQLGKSNLSRERLLSSVRPCMTKCLGLILGLHSQGLLVMIDNHAHPSPSWTIGPCHHHKEEDPCQGLKVVASRPDVVLSFQQCKSVFQRNVPVEN